MEIITGPERRRKHPAEAADRRRIICKSDDSLQQ
jgi:hypothetical protein